MILAQRFPELRSAEVTVALLAQLEGTENRIAYARLRYNEAVQSYNTMLVAFPTNVVASFFGFQPYPYFEVENEQL